MDVNDLELFAFFTTNGKDIWKLESFCMEPTCKLRNMEDGRIEDFGIGGLTSQTFHKIVMPIKQKGRNGQ